MIACATPPAPEEEPDPQQSEAENTTNTAIERQSEIISDNLARIIEATPESLELAIIELSVSEAGSSLRGVELQNVAVEMYRILYPLLEFPEFEVTPPSPASNFPAMFAQVKRGEYPEVLQEDVSFLTLIIPPLAVLETTSTAVAERSMEALNQAASLETQSIIPDLLRGVISERRDQNDAALQYYEAALDLSSGCYPASLGIARVSLDADDEERAFAVLDTLGRRLQQTAAVLRIDARANFQAGNLETAAGLSVDAYNAADNEGWSEREKFPLLLLRAKILEASGAGGSDNQARQLLNIVERQIPDDPEVLLLKSRLLSKDEQYEQALSVMERARSLYTDNREITDAYARLLVKAGRVDQGKEILEESLADSGGAEDEENLQVLLEQAVEAEEWENAADYVTRLLEINEKREYLLTAYRVFRNLDDLESAVEYARRIYELDTSNYDALLRYVKLLIELERMTDARALLEEAIPRAEESAELTGYLSELYYQLSLTRTDLQLKREDLGQATFWNTNNVKAIISLAEVLEELGNRNNEPRLIRKAQQFLNQAIRLNPEDEEIRERVNQLAEKLGE